MSLHGMVECGNIPIEILGGNEDVCAPQLPSEKCSLRNAWTLWYCASQEIADFRSFKKVIESFRSAEQFLSVCNRMKSVYDMPLHSSCLLLKYSVNPMTSDSSNKSGGQWLINLPKTTRKNLNALWMNTVTYVIEEQFEEFSDQILGATISPRKKTNVIGFWTADAFNEHNIVGIAKRLKKLLSDLNDCTLSYIPHDTRKGVMSNEMRFQIDDIPDDCLLKRALKDNWILWYFERKSTDSQQNYRRVACFQTLKDFYGFYNCARRPHELFIGSGFSLLKSNVNPTCDELWEKGDYLLLRLSNICKDSSFDRIWFETLKCVFSEELQKYNNEILGVMSMVGSMENKICLLISEAASVQHIAEMRTILRRQLGPFWAGELEYKGHKAVTLEIELDSDKRRENFIQLKEMHNVRRILKERFNDVPENLLLESPLKSVWTFWFLDNNINNSASVNQKKVIDCYTTNEFWRSFITVSHPKSLSQGSAYSLFREGILPIWENDRTRESGRWLIKFNFSMKHNELNRYWQELLICLAGGVFNEHIHQISGVVVSSCESWWKLSLWITDTQDVHSITDIGNKLKERLRISNSINMEYQTSNMAEEREQLAEKMVSQQDTTDMLLVRYKIAQQQSDVEDIPSDIQINSQLSQSWTLWFFDCNFRLKYDECWKEILNFNIVQDFLSIYNNIKRPSELKKSCRYSVFRKNFRPVKSDMVNQNGGQWIIKCYSNLKNISSDRIWLMTVLNIIGETLVPSGDLLCGVEVFCKKKDFSVSVWLLDDSVEERVKEIGEALRTKLKIDKKVGLAFFSHKGNALHSEKAYKFVA